MSETEDKVGSSASGIISRFPKALILTSVVGILLWLWEYWADQFLHGFGAILVTSGVWSILVAILVGLAIVVLVELYRLRNGRTQLGTGLLIAVGGVALLLVSGVTLLYLWAFTRVEGTISLLIYTMNAGIGLLLVGVFLSGLEEISKGASTKPQKQAGDDE